MENQEIIFMYGLPASGKTTLSKVYESKFDNYIRIGADDVRKELYGSNDVFGDGEKIYNRILDRIRKEIDKGNSIIYDAVNMKKSYRTDFFLDLFSFYPDIIKSIVVVPTNHNICLNRFLNRNNQERNLSFNKVKEYFSEKYSNQYKKLKEEGWDNVYTCCSKVYIASPFFAPEHRKRAIEVTEFLRKQGIETYLPLENKIKNAWDYPNYEWGRLVFENDKKAIDECDSIIMLSYGRMGSAGTAWEAGYAFGTGKRVIVVEMPEVKLMSLMISNGSYAVLSGLDELYNYDFMRMPHIMDYKMEQK